MLRRRIFSSAMASVMALSSIAVVANAEETAVANYKTKADLEAYIKSFDGFREDGLYDYGSISGENFLNAIEYAENVVAEDGDNDQCTVAYDMLEATYNALKIYSAEELKVLIDSCKATYERGNIYNEELNDEIYTSDSFADFEAAYDEAESVLDSNDSRVITDTYENLDAKKKALSANTVITKAQFRTALKDYETMLSKEYAYDTWRRGTMPGWVNIPSGNYWNYGQKTGVTTYGALYDFLEGWEKTIYDEYDRMDKIKTLNKTSDESIVSAYKLCADAPVILAAWEADDTDRATKATVSKLLKEYHSLLVHDYAADKATELYEAVKTAVGAGKLLVEQPLNEYTTTIDTYAEAIEAGDEWVVDYVNYKPAGYDDKVEVEKEVAASLNVKYEGGNYYIPVDDDGYYAPSEGIDVTTTKVAGVKYKTVNKKSVVDLATFIKLSPEMITATPAAAADVTTPSEELLTTVTESVKAADTAVAQASAGANKILSSEGADAWVEVEPNNWIMGAGCAKASLEGAAFKAANADAQALATDFITKALAALEKAYAMLTELLNATSASVEEVEAEAEAAAAKAEAIEAILDELAGLGTAYSWGDLKTAIIAADADKGNDLVNAVGNFGGAIDYVANKLSAAAEDYLEAAEAGANYGDALEAEKAAAKAARAAAALIVKNADRNGVIDGGYTSEFAAGYSVSKNAGYTVDLETAYGIADFYITTTDKAIIKSDSPVYGICTTGSIVENSANGSSAEWALVHRYLKYALEDKYGTTSGVNTKADVVALIDEAYKLAEETGDAALFAINHDILVDARNDAVNWVKEANKDKKYKDNFKPYAYGSSTKVATEVYGDLKGKYDKLAADLAAFKYSFQQIHDDIAITEDMIDSGELEATPALVEALEKTAYQLSVITPLVTTADDEYNDNDAFTSDRYFQGFNRVFTNGGSYKITVVDLGEIEIAKSEDNGAGPNKSHDLLKTAYEALKAEIEAQTNVTVLKGDVNGDGVVNAFDASQILKNIVNSVSMDVAVADYDGSGVVNALDASAILKAIVNA